MKHIQLLFITIALFFANIGSAYSSFATSDFEENEEDIQIIDTGVIYAGQKLRGILNYYSKLDLSKQENRQLIDKISTNKVKNIEEYLKLFKEKFTITMVTKYKHQNLFCDNNAYDFSIVIRPKAMESLLITITDDNKICKIRDHDIKNKRYRDEDLLEDPDYWL